MRQENDEDLQRCTALWARAENQLYPLILADPDAYERAVTVIRGVADRLRAADTAAALARAFRESGELATSAAAQAGTPAEDLDADVLTAAGFRMRQQEIARERSGIDDTRASTRQDDRRP
ncbi:MAG: hypothetical protein ACRDNZ_15680 [Streptosporangiaceae bacterium]